MRRTTRVLALLLLSSIYLVTVAAPFFSPYSPRRQFREFFFAPPSSITFQNPSGGWGLRPYLRLRERVDLTPSYRDTGELRPIRFWVSGPPYRWLGLTFRTRLVGVEGTDQPLLFFGSDNLGRDLFSRILHGGQFSLAVGLASICASLLLGVSAGLMAGYYAGWVDSVVMRLSELFLAIPNIFLVLGISAVVQRGLGLWQVFWLMAGVFTLFGWAALARVVRGQTLGLKSREHVLAARVLGASDFRILTRHILPLMRGLLFVQATLLTPAFTLGEVTLSFLGVGVREPDASWGNLLTGINSFRTLTQFPWLLAPAAFIFASVLGFNLLGDSAGQKESRRFFW